MKQLVHLAFIFTAVANVVIDEFLCKCAGIQLQMGQILLYMSTEVMNSITTVFILVFALRKSS